MSESTALAILPNTAVSVILGNSNEALDILTKIAAEVNAFEADVTKPNGRKAIASMAAKIASAKMDMIRIGKAMTIDWRDKTKAVNAECNIIEEKMDALKQQVRQPLTDFENAEKQRVQAHEFALREIQETPEFYTNDANTSDDYKLRLAWLKAHPDRNWEEFKDKAMQVIANEFNQVEAAIERALKREAEAAELARLQVIEAEQKRQAEEAARIEREAQIAREAELRATLAAEKKAAEEAAAVHAAAVAATEAAQRKIDDALAAAEKAKKDAAEAEAQAERKAEYAAAAERARIEREAAAKQAADDARAADTKHRTKINNEIVSDLRKLELAEDTAKAIVRALVKGMIRNVSVSY